MRMYVSNFIVFATALLFWTACQKESLGPQSAALNFVSSPVATENAVVLTSANDEERVISLYWPEVEYQTHAPILYTLEFAKPDDALGANAWKTVFIKEAGVDVTILSLTGKELNDVALGVGLPIGIKSKVVMRVKASQGSVVYSKPLEMELTPHSGTPTYDALWVAGHFQGWDISTAPKIVSVKNDGIYEGYLYLPAGGTNEFKLYAQPDWAPLSYGTKNDGNIIEANYSGDNFIAPSAGYYLFAVNMNTKTYLLIKTSWGLIGGATPGGWDADTPMTFDAANKTWSVTADMKANGTFKFRANEAWQLDFGVDDKARLVYANHPWKEYVDQGQLSVPSDGNYTITLKLHEPGNYTYTITKN